MPFLIALAVIALVLIAVTVLGIFGAILHFFLSPWLLLLVVAVLAWIKFGPRRSRR